MINEKISVGVIGATGMVGQDYIRLLNDNPWFEVAYVAASPRSAGKHYREAVAGRWHMITEIPSQVGDLVVEDAGNVGAALGKCSVIFSAVDLAKEAVRKLEMEYASRGFAVISNNSAHRQTENVPMLIAEVNHEHCDVIPAQQKHYGWTKGLIVVKPNCSIQSYMIPIHALLQKGFRVERMVVTTLQGLSGAGYPGPSSLDMVDNIIPHIGGEEEKSENGMAVVVGRLRPCKVFDYRFVGLSHNTVRGAAGGAILMAELLKVKGYIERGER